MRIEPAPGKGFAEVWRLAMQCRLCSQRATQACVPKNDGGRQIPTLPLCDEHAAVHAKTCAYINDLNGAAELRPLSSLHPEVEP